jgi:hypothetical protein
MGFRGSREEMREWGSGGRAASNPTIRLKSPADRLDRPGMFVVA